jgi:hypothetical protein
MGSKAGGILDTAVERIPVGGAATSAYKFDSLRYNSMYVCMYPTPIFLYIDTRYLRIPFMEEK